MESIASFTKLFNKIRSHDNSEKIEENDVPLCIKDIVTTPESAFSCVKSGNRIFVCTACVTPRTLTRTLEDLDKNLDDVKLYHFMVNGAISSEKGLPKTRFFHTSFFVNTEMRDIIKQGEGDYMYLHCTGGKIRCSYRQGQ